MNLFHEFCHPTRWYSKLIAACLALTFFTFPPAAIIACYMVYRMVAPVGAQSALDLTNFPGHPDEITYSTPSDGDRTAWFFPGLTSAPVVGSGGRGAAAAPRCCAARARGGRGGARAGPPAQTGSGAGGPGPCCGRGGGGGGPPPHD